LDNGYIINRFGNETEKVILDDETKRYIKYLLSPHEIFARLFGQYILKKVKSKNLVEKGVITSSNIPRQWSKEEFDKIYWEMDNLFKRKGWVK
jgi:hypothetical protein